MLVQMLHSRDPNSAKREAYREALFIEANTA